ncbi:TPA: peptidase [Candidatus Saccharibacteria bacterium]|nr:peptidase [Candidatus Saccharibacteria bacterium]|tara:strand:- start:318 stop:1424 length:1107 start_codon:yes stop_codon:yes gene_type:complete
MVKRLQINSDVLLSYIEGSGIALDTLQERVKDIGQFVGGEKMPTFNQLEKISSLINVPVGLLTLKQQVNIDTQRLSFRTPNSAVVSKMSAELRDTIIEMQEKQSFLQEQIDDNLDLSSDNIRRIKDHIAIAEAIRARLRIPINHLGHSKDNPVRYFRNEISKIGVFVFFNGKIRDNTHRPLSSDEFRGFSLKSAKAPIIFVNQKDSSNAQLFTLVHELVHLFIDDEGISTITEQRDFDHTQEEALVNRVTAEILVPKVLFEKETSLDVEELSKKYKVSRYVIARRLLDLDKIDKSMYDSIIGSLTSNAKPRKKPKGGDYNKNLVFRVDDTFFRFVHNAIMQDRVSYTEAFRLVGTGYKGFKTLESELI